MRISDWSSDVCSSDLVGTPVFSAQVPGFTQILHWDSESNSHELQLISPTDLLNDHLSFVGGIYYLRERFKTSEAYQFGTFGCNLVYANLAATLYNACLANTGTNAFDEAFDQTTDSIAGYGQRSEEHTSELQSLMRISYAVFCLKKK